MSLNGLAGYSWAETGATKLVDAANNASATQRALEVGTTLI
jgi:hypothetical protein